MSRSVDGAGLIAIVGPSGAGKDTLIAGLRERLPDLTVARRTVTRPPEAMGEEIDSVTPDVFSQHVAEGAFALHWEAHGLRYGVPIAIEADLARGRPVLFNGSRVALPEARRRYPAMSVVLVTASTGVLAARLAERGRETQAEIAERLERGRVAAPEGADIVVNDTTPAAGVERLEAIVRRVSDALAAAQLPPSANRSMI